ncbi:hypothetical protein MTBBW1_720006 [Desulfamplus magnetovallimortis]|uniref:Uncharacterized protein n=1 Tax=Desulfamplus magnetovallimortis TaxID=1246637 RepID=A0A1W1HIW9_9BACT|nr:hypothetical protein MTBBW1_720006 [Desulfamplus magnetovallimortis]
MKSSIYMVIGWLEYDNKLWHGSFPYLHFSERKLLSGRESLTKKCKLFLVDMKDA